MEPVTLATCCWGALLLYKVRFSQHAQMRSILRAATSSAPPVRSVDKDRRAAHRADNTDRTERTDRTDPRSIGSRLAAALLVFHAVVALYVSFAPTTRAQPACRWFGGWRPNTRPEVDLWRQLAILGSLIAHIVFNAVFMAVSTARSTRRDVPSETTDGARWARYNGRYIKDRAASEPMDPLCDLMDITGIMRYALRFIAGSDVAFGPSGEFSFAAFSVVRWFKIRESYVSGGGPSTHRRRDLRGGGMRGTVTIQDTGAKDGGVEVVVVNRFGGYREGTLQEVFTWPSADGRVMEVRSVLENEHGRATFTQVFRKEEEQKRKEGG